MLKPPSSKLRAYTPGGNAGKRYSPVSEVTAVCEPSADGLVAVTVTPGKYCACASVTLPLNGSLTAGTAALRERGRRHDQRQQHQPVRVSQVIMHRPPARCMATDVPVFGMRVGE